MHLPDGLYDAVLTDAVRDALARTLPEAARTVAPLSADEAPRRLAEAIAGQLAAILDDLHGEGADKLARQLDLANTLLVYARQRLALEPAGEVLVAPAQVLKAIHRHTAAPVVPAIGLAAPWLFTAGKGSPALLAELRRELAACDGVDILVSFITHSGVRKLLDVLQAATAVGADGRPRTRVRILTTTYTGATEVRALDALAALPGCEVRISLDGRRTRLHAKAWLFRRASGFGSAYVGSANLSGAALMGGLEWTVKFTQRAQAELYARAGAHFETLWEDREFEPYDPANPAHRTALGQALERESGDGLMGRPTFFDLQPKAYQQAMLDQLQAERDHGRWRNLLVAATGTGKTVVAAFDYLRSCTHAGGRPRLLFVAHREEILRQALRTWREVLRDHSFGELLAGGRDPEQTDHVFATIDSVTSRALVERCGPAHWHTVVVDECHRLAADRFHAFVTAVRPRVLLGLTATPERSDGKPILGYFDCRADGSPAVELRLWHALDLELLCPFEYYACDDDTDFAAVPWDQPGELAALDRLVTGNHVRARLVINEWRRLGEPAGGRALVFCVSVAHARFMTDQLNAAGIRAACVVGETATDERRRAPERLARGEIAAIVTCDLYNEGVDLPQVNTLVLLRPTQSPVLFQQQIGRGLRLAPGKESCLVLDFVGRHRQEFRFDRLYGVLTGLARGQLIEAVEHGFGSLPPGCHIHLARQTREQVLASVRALVQHTWRRLRTELQAYAALRGRADVRLADFLREQAVELEDLYRNAGRSGWTCLKRDAGLPTASARAPEDEYFGRRFGDLLHWDDPQRHKLLARVAEPAGPCRPDGEREERLVQMLAYQVDAQHHQRGTGAQFLERLTPAHRAELGELGEVLQARAVLAHRPVPGLEDVPLCLHAGYGVREILTAVGWLSAERRQPFQAGTLTLPQRRTELLFVTLDKREGYHERIAYHDYAISPDRFHWQSQNSAAPDTGAGRRYLESPGNGWIFQLFVRTARGRPYRACGPVTVEQAEGARPMTLRWKLGVPLPVALFQEFSVLRDS